MNHPGTRKTALFSALIAALFVFVFFACVKEYRKPIAKTDYSPLLAVPLINSSLTIHDLLVKEDHNGNIQVDPYNFLTLIYRGKLFSLEADNFIQFPDQSVPFTSPALTPADVAAFNALPAGSQYAVPFPVQTFTFNTNNTADVDSVVFKAGTTLDVVISSQFMHNAAIKVDIPKAKKNGAAFSKTINLIYSGTLPATSTSHFDISGYTFDMTEGGTTQNAFDVNIAVTLTKSGNPLNLTDNASVSIGFTQPLFQKLFGYIKQPLISPNIDTVAITLFDNAMPGGGIFTIVNPQARILLSNSYGVPIDATFNMLSGYNPPAALYPITVTTEPKLNPWHFPYPTIAQIGQFIHDSVMLNNTNTNNTIGTALNQHPRKFIYQLNAQANPNGKPVAPNTNFALDTSRFIVNFQIDLPLYGTTKNILMMDTVPLTLGDNVGPVESLLFRIYASNGFPLEMGLQAYFTDSISPAQQYHVLDSLISPYQVILPAAGVDVSGKVNAPAIKTTDISFDKARITGIKNVRKLIIKGAFATTNNGNTNVKFYSDYKLDVKVGVMAQVKTKI